jgi:signal transduction histidine kinase/ActR/RegA family two-component response regulator
VASARFESRSFADDDSAPSSGAGVRRIPIVRGGHRYGTLVLEVTDDELFRRYRPCLQIAAALTAAGLERPMARQESQQRQPAIGNDDGATALEKANAALAAEIGARSRAQVALKFLGEASMMLAESLDFETTLSRVARLAVAAFADWCLVDLVREDETVGRVAVAHSDPTKEEVASTLRRHTVEVRGDQNQPPARAMVRGRSVLIERLTDEQIRPLVGSDEDFEVLRGAQLRSLLSVPLVARGRTLGVFTFASSRNDGPYQEADLAIAEQLAHRAALSIENARLYLEATEKSASLQAANRTKDEFLAMLGHELRNPLAPIVTALQLMRARGDGDAFPKERAIIERQTCHLIRLVDDLLDVSRITRGKVALHKRNIELGAVVSKALEIASVLLEERGHRLRTAVASVGLGVAGDEDRLAQVIANLLTNAAKYTAPGGSITVTGAREAEWVVLTVADDGLGIDPELLPRIFDRFVQGQRGLDRAEGGLGLGLAIVRSLVEMHGGQVSARSEGPGKGSEFIVRLPWVEAAAGDPARDPAGTADGDRAVVPKRVLIVDDNRDAAVVLEEALGELGHVTRSAFDAPSALCVARDFGPDVALLDIGLPVMDGYELARRLRDLPGMSGIRLVAVTGYGQDADRARSRDAGFYEHLVKPIDLDQVTRALGASGSGAMD